MVIILCAQIIFCFATIEDNENMQPDADVMGCMELGGKCSVFS